MRSRLRCLVAASTFVNIDSKPKETRNAEPVIRNLKAEHWMGRIYLAHRTGEAAHTILAAAGYNLRLFLRWLRFMLFQILCTFIAVPRLNPV